MTALHPLTMAKPSPVDPTSEFETQSTVSETSAAVVSLYNSWSANDASSLLDDDDLLSIDDRFAKLPETVLSCEELLERLRRTCREEDLPPQPILRDRKRPNCRFLNFMGSRQPSRTSVLHESTPTEIFFDFGLEEKDELYPLFSSKAKYCDAEQQENDREAKKPRLLSEDESERFD